MTAIAGASAGVKDMADGSLRITIEFEPRDAREAFALFGSRGTPIAVAALKPGFAAASDELPVEPQKRKDTRGPLCREACDLCANGQFQRWIGVADMPRAELAAREWVIAKCRVLSRKQLDENPRAAELFKQEVRIPFFRFQKEASYGGWGE